MTAKTTTNKQMTTTNNLDVALVALTAELGASVGPDELEAYIAKLNDLAVTITAIRAQHAKAIAVLASKRSRAKSSARVAKALELLAKTEADEAKSAE